MEDGLTKVLVLHQEEAADLGSRGAPCGLPTAAGWLVLGQPARPSPHCCKGPVPRESTSYLWSCQSFSQNP